VVSCPPGPCNVVTTPTFSLAISTQQDTVKIGSAIAVLATKTNRSGHKWIVSDCQDNPVYNYKYNVFDANGNIPPRTEMGRNVEQLQVGHCPIGFIVGGTVVEDGRPSKPDEIIISDLFAFSPGRYTVQFEEQDVEIQTIVKSNTITVTVTP
jgi:hypothetical protein